MNSISIKNPKDHQLKNFALPLVGTKLTCNEAQELAVAIAWQGIGRVAPNPLVGAVVVDAEHRFLGAGSHLQCGSSHAEVNAIENVLPNDKPRMHSIYVTLEPCAHANRTPACAPWLTQWPSFKKVVYGCIDPNPKVNGQGAKILQEAGIDAVFDQTWQPSCEALCEVFRYNIQAGKPFVAIKAAVSLNQVLAQHGDRRRWITNERARSYGHFLRGYYDAILVGSQTLIHDNPHLDTRLSLHAVRAPQKIVLDPTGEAANYYYNQQNQSPLRMLEHNPERIIWVTSQDWNQGIHSQALQYLKDRDVQICPIKQSALGQFHLDNLLDTLYQRGICSILVEGGSHTYAGFLQQALVQKLHLFQAPTLIAGDSLIRWLRDDIRLPDIKLDNVAITPLADNWVIEGQLTFKVDV